MLSPSGQAGLAPLLGGLAVGSPWLFQALPGAL